VIGAKNVKGGLVLLSLGLLAGLAMSLYAFEPIVRPPASLDAYDDLPRRLIRLAHISAIMLPLLNVVLGGWIDRLALPRRAREAASQLLLWGGALVPVTLGLQAAWAPARSLHLAGGPVVAFCLGVFLVTLGALRADFRGMMSEEWRQRTVSSSARSPSSGGGSPRSSSASASTSRRGSPIPSPSAPSSSSSAS
jgi:hypothetical protein